VLCPVQNHHTYNPSWHATCNKCWKPPQVGAMKPNKALLRRVDHADQHKARHPQFAPHRAFTTSSYASICLPACSLCHCGCTLTITTRGALLVQRIYPSTRSKSAAISNLFALVIVAVAHSNAAGANSTVYLSALHSQSCSTSVLIRSHIERRTDAIHAHVSRMHLHMHKMHATHSGTGLYLNQPFAAGTPLQLYLAYSTSTCGCMKTDG
jgi:hypothetical protein